MSVVTWEPRIAMTAAELTVDFPGHNEHIVEQRKAIEESARPVARRVALVVSELEIIVPPAATDALAARLERGLEKTMNFGYREAQREIRALHAPTPVRAAVVLPADVGEFGALSQKGRDGVRELIYQRSRQASRAIGDSVVEAAKTPGLSALDREGLLLKTATRALHNSVLELVGETLNMGRTAGALDMPGPPEFAFRSEQLDKRTCDSCSRLHGQIAALGTSEYFALLPPSGCLGGGRCRGLMIFGFGPQDFRVEESFDYQDTFDDHLGRSASEDTISARDAVSALLNLARATKLPVVEDRGLGEARGVFRNRRDGPALEIRLNPDQYRLSSTLNHEIGHFIDYEFVGANRFASETAAVELEEWWAAVRASRAYRDLVSSLSHAGSYDAASYLFRGRELFARSFAQWVALRSGNPVLRSEMAQILADERLAARPLARQWADDDFDEIAAALDRLFERLGLLRR